MRVAIVHCPNPECRLKVWVPEEKLGSRGRCPKCGHQMRTPPFVPADELGEGPPLILDPDGCEESVAGVA